MSRVSLFKRAAFIRNALLPPGSMVYREYHLPEREKRWLRHWRNECSALIEAAERDGPPGEAYRRLIEGELALPPMPHALELALGMERLLLPADATAHEAAEAYTRILDEGRHDG